MSKSSTFDSQTELEELNSAEVPAEESPRHNRYSSPLFQQLLVAPPIEPIKISQPSIPDDDNISSLLRVASLVSRTQKSDESPAVVITNNSNTEQQLTETNSANEATNLHHESDTGELLNIYLVTEKRPSIQDPQKVLMDNLVPGENCVACSLHDALLNRFKQVR